METFKDTLETTLTKVKAQVAFTVSEEFADSLVIDSVPDYFAGVITHKFTGWAYAEDLEEKIYEYSFPYSWWEQWKQECAPAWFRARFPVKYRKDVVKFRVQATYPFASDKLPALGIPKLHAFLTVDENVEDA